MFLRVRVHANKGVTKRAVLTNVQDNDVCVSSHEKDFTIYPVSKAGRGGTIDFTTNHHHYHHEPCFY
ncbi:hypothetical protein E2C01_023172 [Portunus trituberculatus]|uniref:Uncharacterized protein n=1 Tax=Portunus trituberculatus TaxID=210409 RepID=A0A5B7E7A0_PORTR|nr:hypothetical protein [Portunus trituberculatus]